MTIAIDRTVSGGAARQQRARAAHPGAALTLTVIAVSAAAWLVIAWLHGRGHHGAPSGASGHHAGHTTGHHADHAASAAGTGGATALITAAGWMVMVVAMMLPPALPLLHTIRRLTVRHAGAAVLVTLAGAAFVAVWSAVGVLFWLGGRVVDSAQADVALLRDHPRLVPASAIALAGLFQFTPLKAACLTACRSPRAVVLAHWHGRHHPAVEVTNISARFAASCVGCCWALMIVTFAVGAAAMPVMVVLAAVMAAERFVPRVRTFVPLIGLAALWLAALVAFGLVPAGLN